MNNSLYKCPICGGPTNCSSINYQPQPCLHCYATLKPAKHGENHGAGFDGGKDIETTTPAPTPCPAKSENYWREQYQLMRERYHRQIGENSKLAERIKDLTFLVTELQPKRDYAERIRELEEQLQGSRDQLRDYLLNTDIHPVDSIFWQRMSLLRLALEKIKLWAASPVTAALWETAEGEMRTVLCLMHTIAREAENALNQDSNRDGQGKGEWEEIGKVQTFGKVEEIGKWKEGK